MRCGAQHLISNIQYMNLFQLSNVQHPSIAYSVTTFEATVAYFASDPMKLVAGEPTSSHDNSTGPLSPSPTTPPTDRRTSQAKNGTSTTSSPSTIAGGVVVKPRIIIQDSPTKTSRGIGGRASASSIVSDVGSVRRTAASVHSKLPPPSSQKDDDDDDDDEDDFLNTLRNLDDGSTGRLG